MKAPAREMVIRAYQDAFCAMHGRVPAITHCGNGRYRIDGSYDTRTLADLTSMTEVLERRAERAAKGDG